jgi:hypothetical protein
MDTREGCTSTTGPRPARLPSGPIRTAWEALGRDGKASLANFQVTLTHFSLFFFFNGNLS